MRLIPLLVVLAALAGCVVVTPPVVLSGGGSAVTRAEANCIAAVGSRTGTRDVATRGSEATATGARVILDTPGTATAWECDADRNGNVLSVGPLA